MTAFSQDLSAVGGNANTEFSRGNAVGDKITLWSSGAQGTAYGIGVQASSLVFYGSGTFVFKPTAAGNAQASSSAAAGLRYIVSGAQNGVLQFEQQGNVQSAISHNFLHTAGCAAGDVVVIDTANAGRVTSTTAAGSRLVAGVALFAAAAGANVSVALPGSVVLVNCTTAGAVAVGDLLTTSTVAGQAVANNAAGVGTVVGKALSAKAAGVAGQVWCLVGSA